ncbi:ERV/ALR sulfhydryl oxidase domain-containing protein [Lipomyces kononenkoae]|uniref:ERV/ALR sulfhydryl oxidase domain-containing protein n=1 Tax=Lipomyces kononenkoae TaxID=34357 RepID=A0ACC3T6P2_LIPKO
MTRSMARRPTLAVLAIIATIIIFIITISTNPSPSSVTGNVAAAADKSNILHPKRPVILKSGSNAASNSKETTVSDIADASDYDPLQGPVPVSSQKLSQGGPIMPHLGNETIKAELGRASWKLLHTILARYPEKPTAEEREALSSYIYLFSRVYPCGECASHFQKLLKKFPPQTSSRVAASQWGCHIHNQVNARLGKKIFDCNTIAEKYQCGCEDDVGAAETRLNEGVQADIQSSGIDESKDNTEEFLEVEDHLRGIHIESSEGLTKGG